MNKKYLLKTGITDAKTEEILEYIIISLQKTTEKYYIVTPNPEILVYASKHKAFQGIINNARLALCDGVGVIWAGKIEGKSFKERTTGTDLVKSLCERVAKKPITVGFLGGGPKIAERTVECLRQEFPELRVLVVQQGNPDQKTTEMVKEEIINSQKGGNDPKTIKKNIKQDHFSNHSVTASSSLAHNAAEVANKNFLGSQTDKVQTLHKLTGRSATSENSVSSPRQQSQWLASPVSELPQLDILFVAFGFPKQEEWMAKYLDQLPVKVMIGVGGAFDYISGSVSRAPLWIRHLGFEWLYRLIRQPWRLKRQFALLEFMYLVVKEKLHF